ncbi:MAG: SIR2 family NAD-dependent protein deacylase [Candidatus Hydrogenedentota bacterium]
MNQDYENTAQAITRANKVIALTGAGVSVDSGIPDFRSAGGLWEKYPPEEFATIEAFMSDPEKTWKLWFDLYHMLEDIAPNTGHLALAELEKMGHLDAVITQNIDNLHQEAGNTKVIEYHGNTKRVVCLKCHTHRRFDAAEEPDIGPRCECGLTMKPDVVLFGEPIPHQALLESERLASTCDVVIVVGTSATVYPAAGIPFTAKQHGAFIIECNTQPTEFTNTVTDVFLQGSSKDTLPTLVNWVRR